MGVDVDLRSGRLRLPLLLQRLEQSARLGEAHALVARAQKLHRLDEVAFGDRLGDLGRQLRGQLGHGVQITPLESTAPTTRILSMQRVPRERLQGWALGCLEKAGVPPPEARLVAQSLVQT